MRSRSTVGAPISRSAFQSAFRSTEPNADLRSVYATFRGWLNSRCRSDSRRGARIAYTVERCAVKQDCCGRRHSATMVPGAPASGVNKHCQQYWVMCTFLCACNNITGPVELGPVGSGGAPVGHGFRASNNLFRGPCIKKVKKPCCRGFGWVSRAPLGRLVGPWGSR